MQDLIEAYMSVYGDIEEAKLPYTRRSMGLESQFVPKTGEEKTQARIDQLRQSHNTADNRRANTLDKKRELVADREAAQAKSDAMTRLRNRERTRAQAARDMEESHKFPLSPEELELARKIGQHADTKAKRMSAESPTKSAKKKTKTKMSDVDVKESHDFFDVVLSHLLDEGYCDSQESAITMMAAMSQNWIDSIVEEFVDPEHGETPSGRTPMQNIEDKSNRVRKKAIRGFQKQMGKEYGGNWKYVQR